MMRHTYHPSERRKQAFLLRNPTKAHMVHSAAKKSSMFLFEDNLDEDESVPSRYEQVLKGSFPTASAPPERADENMPGDQHLRIKRGQY